MWNFCLIYISSGKGHGSPDPPVGVCHRARPPRNFTRQKGLHTNYSASNGIFTLGTVEVEVSQDAIPPWRAPPQGARGPTMSSSAPGKGAEGARAGAMCALSRGCAGVGRVAVALALRLQPACRESDYRRRFPLLGPCFLPEQSFALRDEVLIPRRFARRGTWAYETL